MSGPSPFGLLESGGPLEHKSQDVVARNELRLLLSPWQRFSKHVQRRAVQ